jgi:amidase
MTGYVSWIGKPAQSNAVLVDVLEAAGAVLYVKTNVPQTLMVRNTNCTIRYISESTTVA